MTDLVRLVDDAGVELLAFDGDAVKNLNPTLRNLDLGYPSVRDVTDVLPGQDGEYDGTRYMGGRAITAELLLGMTGVVPMADKIRAVMHPGRRMWLYIRMDEWLAERRILVRGASLDLPMGPLPWAAQLAWRAPSPTFQDVAQQQVILSPSGQVSGGMSFPMSFPMSFDPGLVPGAATITVGGNTAATPVIDVYGPCDDPLFRVVDTDEQIRLVGVSIAAGDFVRIDVGARTILLNNQLSGSLYGNLDFATSVWPTLPAGQVQVVFSPEAASAGCQAVLTWANTWI